MLRGDEPEDSYFTGENLRGYFASLGKIESPVATVPVETAGNENSDLSRPGREDAARADARADMKNRFEQAFAKAARLKGQEGRAQIFSGRKAALRGTSIDTQLAASLQGELPNSQTPAQAAGAASQLNTATAAPSVV